MAVSFVRHAEDVVLAKALIRRAGRDTPVIAKLEKPEAIENLDAILRVADGVMVARGDLGVEMNPERVPVVQKMIIAKARESAAAGDYGDADAGVDDAESAADARGGFGCGECDFRWVGCGDAIGGDGFGKISGGSGEHDGADYRRCGGEYSRSFRGRRRCRRN